MANDFEREFRRFQIRVETEMRMMEEAAWLHEAAMERAVREHQEAIERACDEFERKFGHWPPGLRRPRGKWRKPDRDLDLGGVPVKPNNPKGLSGGAAASIDASD